MGMGRALKTKDVAEALGVSSRTIQRWVRNYNVPYQTNAKGHFQFTEQHVKLLEKIRDQISSQSATASPQVKPQVKEEENKKVEEIKPQNKEKPAELSKMEERLNDLETIISNKADQVVYEQVLGHRRELEHLSSRLDDLESKLANLEELMDELKTQLETEQKQKRPRFFSRFSLARS
jgi:chromosome-anchoring protein RacA